MPPSGSQLLLWLLLAAPGAADALRYATGVIGYGEALQASGVWSVRLLIATLAVSGLRVAFPRAGWATWLAKRRRDLGVATFAYAAFHLGIYLAKKAPMPSLILREGAEPGMAVGWIAFVVFALLAATSNDASVRLLGRRWKALHRWVYAGAALTVAHWLLTAFEPTEGLLHAAVLAAVVGIAWALKGRRGRRGPG
jgi:methionine sulfoxide reductase heme-binding subunit